MQKAIKPLFPFKEYREHQLETIEQCINYFEEGIEVVIIDGPVGFGKSPVNIAIGSYFAPSYYTTPQKKLREQLGSEFGPKELAIDGGIDDIIVLKAREDYICKSSKKGRNCNECEKRENHDHKCSTDSNCTYWKQKEALFESELGILTFSNLIVNSYIPEFNNGKQISFEKRKLLIVDECHSLEGQTASLHTGFKLTPNSFLDSSDSDKEYSQIEELKQIIWNELEWFLPDMTNSTLIVSDFVDALKKIPDIINQLKNRNKIYSSIFEIQKNKEKLENILNKINYMFEELDEGRKWVVNIKNNLPKFQPIKIDRFLIKHIWKYGNKFLLTSATIPFPNNIPEWLKRIGLGNKEYRIIPISMNFPIKNRPIYLNKIGGSLSGNNKKLNWDGCVKNTKEILKKYKGKRGVIHVSSYSIMWDLFNSIKKDNFSIFLHNKTKLRKDKEEIIQAWNESGKEVLISPTIFEGVDLKDDLCRFQILFKVPFADPTDKRVHHFLNFEENGWEWYYNETMVKICQAYGRAIRSKDDYADFYIIDGAFLPFYSKVVFPEWFKEAIVR